MSQVSARLEVFVDSYSPIELDRRSFIPFSEGMRIPGPKPEPAAHSLVEQSFAWPESIAPRWRGQDTSRCVAGITTRTAQNDQLNRLRSGARVRGETAIVLVELADARGSRATLGGTPQDVVTLPSGGSIGRRPLPIGVNAHVAEGLEAADKDLCLRIRNTHEATAPWFALTIGRSPMTLLHDLGSEEPSSIGTLHPLLVDDVGDTVAAVWLPEGKNERWYVFPIGSSWESLLGWLVDQAVPAYVPQAASRVRSFGTADVEFATTREREALDALRGFDERVASERAVFQAALKEAREAAAPTREALLYGRGDVLKRVVASVLASCGLQVEDLDATFGGGKSGDLLVSFEQRHWIVEVRSQSGSASEQNVSDVVKHMRTWSSLGRSEALEGGVLALNHNHKDAPAARPRVPYPRREFVESLPGFGVTVISTVQLCEWWALDYCDALRTAVTGSPSQYPAG